MPISANLIPTVYKCVGSEPDVWEKMTLLQNIKTLAG